jgi:sugar/nucleoside kinase (ribokinase family)
MSTRFVAVGELMLDVVATGRGHEARVDVTPGGSAAIAAAWAAHAGADAEVIGRVGDDFAGRSLRAALQAAAIGGLLLRDAEHPTGTFLLVDDEARAHRGANAAFAPEHLPSRIAADAVLLSGYLQRETVAEALARAEAPWIGLSPARLEELPDGANVLVLNEEEARRLTGKEPADAAATLGERFRVACVTRGEAGAVARADGELYEIPGQPGPANALGAGDAFAAGLLVALARGADPSEALDAAALLGAAAAVAGPWPPAGRA